MSAKHAQRFMTLFAGLPRAYGIYKTPMNLPAGSKRKGDAKTMQEPVTEPLWQQHLDGDIQLGIVPIRDDATCVFGAIDVDDYKLDHKALEKKVVERKLPLILCKSKSGGGHLYAFFKEHAECSAVRELLSGWAAALGYSNVEIFPKQDALLSSNDTGNWINMPYRGGDSTECYAIKGGEPLSMKQFLDLAEKIKVAASIFDSSDESPELLQDGPPCLITLASSGYPEGTRNAGLFNLGVYCRKRWPDDWEVKLEEMNQAFMSPPLDSGEVKQVINHLGKKEYNYRCKDAPIDSLCQRSICLKRQYGVDSIDSQRMFGPVLDNVLRLETDPAVYFADFEGRRITFTAKHLSSQSQLRELLLNQANKTLMIMTPVKFIKWVETITQKAELVQAPPETSNDQVIIDYLEEYCLDKWPANNWDDVIDGAAYDFEGRTHFRPHKFVQSVNREHRLKLRVAEVYQALLKLGCAREQRKIRRKTYPLWSVPQFERPAERDDKDAL